jgi:hypothetical protein
MWHVDAHAAPVPADPVADFLHGLNNRLLEIRCHTTLALMALDAGEAAAELQGLLEVVDAATAASRNLRRTLATPAA